MFKRALLLGALAAIVGTVDAAAAKKTKTKTKPKTKPTGDEAESAKQASKDQNPVLRSIDKNYKIL